MQEQQVGLPGGLTVGTFPIYREQVRNLIESHKKLEDHQLLLAIWFDKGNDKDIKILEVLKGFPSYDTPMELFTTHFDSTREFLIAAGGKLILSLTGPEDMEKALEQDFLVIQKIKTSFAEGQAEVLYESETMGAIVERLKNG